MYQKNGYDQRYPVLFEEFENEKKKRTILFWASEAGIFGNFTTQDLNFHGR